MKLDIQIYDKYKTEVVGFNGSGLPLGERQDLHLLAELAHINPNLKRYFKRLPTLEQLQSAKAEAFLEKNPPVLTPEENADVGS